MYFVLVRADVRSRNKDKAQLRVSKYYDVVNPQKKIKNMRVRVITWLLAYSYFCQNRGGLRVSDAAQYAHRMHDVVGGGLQTPLDLITQRRSHTTSAIEK